MAAIFQMTFSNAYACMKMYGLASVRWLVYWCIYASLCLIELNELNRYARGKNETN